MLQFRVSFDEKSRFRKNDLVTVKVGQCSQSNLLLFYVWGPNIFWLLLSLVLSPYYIVSHGHTLFVYFVIAIVEIQT